MRHSSRMIKRFVALPSATLLTLIFFGTLDGNADEKAGKCTARYNEDSGICERYQEAGASYWKYTKCVANANASLNSCMQSTSGSQANKKGGTTPVSGTKRAGQPPVFVGTQQPPSTGNKFG